MKNLKLSFSIALLFALFFFASCEKTEVDESSPAETISGTYVGSFDGTYNSNTVQVASGYQVVVTPINDNRVRVSGADFNAFEVELQVLTNNHQSMITPVTTDNMEFRYYDNSNEITFDYTDNSNTAQFAGEKQ